eukprot:gnl/MRDRNA2_/MRDRNA2_149266_c0_seq1.p1 gnl/MRDRNA2_/MRDRNA2_149266_c0~~gnl/MRDRNA2_/MRDRNA2_149266_c0_seq1.p1  ORF type:complete len:257 (-),score=15.82 gnl/MRDRNA2_/MRDRNA2_149266_c0_seq1:180-926(-)
MSNTLRKIDAGYSTGNSSWSAEQLVSQRPHFWGLTSDGHLGLRLSDPMIGKLTCKVDSSTIDSLKCIAQSTTPVQSYFFGQKDKIVLGETLCRVEDTCSMRSNVFCRRASPLSRGCSSESINSIAEKSRGDRVKDSSVRKSSIGDLIGAIPDKLEDLVDRACEMASKTPFKFFRRPRSRSAGAAVSREFTDTDVFTLSEINRAEILRRNSLASGWMGRRRSLGTPRATKDLEFHSLIVESVSPRQRSL